MSRIAALVILAAAATAAQAVSPRLPPVVVHIADAGHYRCTVTADGQPIAIKAPPPPAIRQQMRARGVRLTFARPKPDFYCISNTIFPLQREGIEIRN